MRSFCLNITKQEQITRDISPKATNMFHKVIVFEDTPSTVLEIVAN